MGIFGDKDSIVGAALGVGGAFDKNRKQILQQYLERHLEQA